MQKDIMGSLVELQGEFLRYEEVRQRHPSFSGCCFKLRFDRFPAAAHSGIWSSCSSSQPAYVVADAGHSVSELYCSQTRTTCCSPFSFHTNAAPLLSSSAPSGSLEQKHTKLSHFVLGKSLRRKNVADNTSQLCRDHHLCHDRLMQLQEGALQ